MEIYNYLFGWEEIFTNLDNEHGTLFNANPDVLKRNKEINDLILLRIMTRRDAEIIVNNSVSMSIDIKTVFDNAQKNKWSEQELISELEKLYKKYGLSDRYIDYLITNVQIKFAKLTPLPTPPSEERI